ncbi:MAG: glycine cleavage system protein GcvH [Deltaproteobacteria bacterium]|jgi:glycine cleavage system H protein|nr:glycine cleavage system protein GcvH [Deltaproteobacteria bacterium]
MNTPADLKYTAAHAWVRLEGAIAVTGITDFAQEKLGDVTFVELPSVGTRLKEGERMGSIESIKATSNLFAPVSGVVLEVNGALDDACELVNISPYGDGWMLKIKVEGDPAGLISADEYARTAT